MEHPIARTALILAAGAAVAVVVVQGFCAIMTDIAHLESCDTFTAHLHAAARPVLDFFGR
jgi:hypothetical protein